MPKSPRRNPYIVGRWVAGANYYGHAGLHHSLLNDPNKHLWVLSTRRAGKTSLLRKLEAEAGPDYLPIYWDVQGCQSEEDLSGELQYAVEEKRKAFEAVGLDVATLTDSDTREVLRKVCAAADAHDRQVLLLVDEPEVFVAIAVDDPGAIQRLRAAMQRPANLRVILASTNAFAQMNEVSRDWLTSPFLYGFAPRLLSSLSPEDATALVRQTQGPEPVKVSDETVAAIQEHTNNHPYLLQWLCSRLFQPNGSLRIPTAEDIVLEPMLNAFFAVTYRHLSPTERNILSHLLESGPTDVKTLASALQLPSPEVRSYLYALQGMGYTRRVKGGYAIGGVLFRRWLEDNARYLSVIGTEVSDTSVQEVAQSGRDQEIAFTEQQLQTYRLNLGQMELQAANYGSQLPEQLANEIEFHQRKIKELEYRLDALHA